MQILVVDTDTQWTEHLVGELRHAGLKARTASTLPQSGGTAPVVIIDPRDGSVADVVERAGDAAVIVTTHGSSASRRVEALEAGAADVVNKHGSLRELALRARAVLSRTWSRAPSTILAGGRVRVDPEARQMWLDGEEVDLTPLELGVLTALMRADGAVLTRETLLEQVWSDPTVTTEAVEGRIRSLRRKLRDARGVVETVRGSGYRFNG